MKNRDKLVSKKQRRRAVRARERRIFERQVERKTAEINARIFGD